MSDRPDNQFDFWLGEWIVTWGEDGKGTNHIERILDGKIIQENFFAPDLHGMSVSSFNPERGLWCQTWVDNTGTYLDFTGKFEAGKMILSRDAIVKGQACSQRMVWYDIQQDKIDWNWERSDDNGRTWRVLWQIHYRRKKSSGSRSADDLAISAIIGGMNQKPLSPSAQKVDDALRALGYHFDIIEHAESTRTAQEAAERAGCELGQIVKSLIFKGKVSGKPILVLTSGANRVDEKLISGYAGEAIGRADADFVRSATGFAIGGVPPIGHPQIMETYLDEDFLQYETIWAAAGNPNAIFELPAKALQEITAAKVVRVK